MSQVYIKTSRSEIEVVVMGIDSRRISSASAYLQQAAEDSGSHITNENPHGVPTPEGHYYTGFTAEEDDPDYLRTLIKAVVKEAERISWVESVDVVRQWPKFPQKERYAALRSQMLRMASDLPAGDPTRRKLLSAVKTAGWGRGRNRHEEAVDIEKMVLDLEKQANAAWVALAQYEHTMEDDDGISIAKNALRHLSQARTSFGKALDSIERL